MSRSLLLSLCIDIVSFEVYKRLLVLRNYCCHHQICDLMTRHYVHLSIFMIQIMDFFNFCNNLSKFWGTLQKGQDLSTPKSLPTISYPWLWQEITLTFSFSWKSLGISGKKSSRRVCNKLRSSLEEHSSNFSASEFQSSSEKHWTCEQRDTICLSLPKKQIK